MFQTGEPRFRKYDAGGTLLFERVIQGAELDASLAIAADDLVPPAARAKCRSCRRSSARPPSIPPGDLWIAFTLPFTYVYDADGEKMRVRAVHDAGLMAPTSLSFARDGKLLVTPGCYVFEPGRPQ